MAAGRAVHQAAGEAVASVRAKAKPDPRLSEILACACQEAQRRRPAKDANDAELMAKAAEFR